MADERHSPREAGLPGEAPAPLHVRLLGDFAVTVAGRAVSERDWGASRKARSLVKLLALAPGQRLTRDQAIDALWPDLDAEAGVNNFHRTLHAARRALAPAQIILRSQLLALAPGAFASDVAEFEAAVATARSAQSPAAYETALSHYAGTLLPEDRYEDWAATRREALHATMAALLHEASQLHEARGEWQQAIEALERLLAAEPTHEEAHVALMRSLALAGRRSEALRLFARLRDVLRRELDAEPDSAARHLHAAILAGRFPEAGSRRVPAAADGEVGSGGTSEQATPRHNLPVPLTSFVGREREVAEVRDLITPTPPSFPTSHFPVLTSSRLVTLTGTGGCGKTRLALRVANDLATGARFPDGIWLIELATRPDPALVPGAVAAALGVSESAERDLLAALIDYLRARRALLILDNCEHLLDACAAIVVALLRACPDLAILATSRRPLGVAGEVVWRVPSFAPPTTEAAPGEIAANDAVRLFIERARLVQPSFALTERNAPAIARICHRLDGLPLALELAAARIPLLAPEQLATRLDDRFRLLSGGNRAAPDRQQTLRAALDWSHALLTADEQSLFARLAVFVGGWTLDLAEAVDRGPWIVDSRQKTAGGNQSIVYSPQSTDTLATLAALVDHNLVAQIGTDPDGQPRFGMLETIRAYALERLEASGEAEVWREHHAASYLAHAEHARTFLVGPEQATWLGRLEQDFGNFRAALAWYADRGEAEAGLRLAVALGRLWQSYAHLREGRHWLEQAFAMENVTVAPQLRATARYAASVLAHFTGDDAAAIAGASASLPLFRDLGDHQGEANALNLLGLAHRHAGDPAQARAFFEASLTVWRDLDEPRNVGMILINLASLAADAEDFAAAAALTEESLPLLRAAGDARFLGIAIANLGAMRTLQGDRDAARPLLADALERCRDTADWRMLSQTLQFAALVIHGEGQTLAAVQLRGAEESLRAATGVPTTPLIRRDYELLLTSAQAALGAEVAAAGLVEGQAWSIETTINRALALLRSPAT